MKLENATYIIAQTNTLLVAEQRPGSAYLASRTVWRRLGRRVKPGQAPIYILVVVPAPCPGSISLGVTRYDEPIFLRSMPVFELDQTTGREFPTMHTCERKENFADEHEVSLLHVSGALAIFGSCADRDRVLDQGVECASCGEMIETESDGVSSPHGSMHAACAAEHEAAHPEEW